MASTAVRLDACPIQAVIPCIAVHQAPSVVDFAKRAFDAQELCRRITPSGALYCEVKIGDSVVMIGGGLQWRGKPKPAALHVYVDDVDSSFARATAVGGKELQVPVDRDYGARAGGVVDAGGNHWYLSTLLPSRRDTPEFIPKNKHTLAPCLHPESSAEIIQFLKQAFGAAETYRAQSQDGRVHHAQVQMGESTLEMGDAHDRFRPMPMSFYIRTPVPDALRERAIEAGAALASVPVGSSFVDRFATLTDPFGNEWNLAGESRGARG
jgi:PhnB protein